MSNTNTNLNQSNSTSITYNANANDECECPSTSKILIAKKQSFSYYSNSKYKYKYTKYENIYYCKECNQDNPQFIIHLNRGGKIIYYHQILNEVEERIPIANFMKSCGGSSDISCDSAANGSAANGSAGAAANGSANGGTSLYRQYEINNMPEPRIHVLLANTTTNSTTSSNTNSSNTNSSNTNSSTTSIGYKYHSIKMKSQPISQAPLIEKLANRLGTKFQIDSDAHPGPDPPGPPNNNDFWNIGVDMILYRNGHDSIGWHADDTQYEDIILSVVVEMDVEYPRTIHIRPKTKKNRKSRSSKSSNILSSSSSSSSSSKKNRSKKEMTAMTLNENDEKIQLFVNQGDGYYMDGEMQKGYEHALLKNKKIQSNRSVLIFRHGRQTMIMNENEHDSGVPSISTDPVPIKPRIWFGHPLATTKVFECSTVHKRKILIQTNCHKCDQGGTVANKTQGCSSIVVSRQNPDYNEYDDFLQFTYSSNINQGAHPHLLF